MLLVVLEHWRQYAIGTLVHVLLQELHDCPVQLGHAFPVLGGLQVGVGGGARWLAATAGH